MSGLKAISLWQPWASLWLTDKKPHDTRHWQTPHRGWLAVHAAKKFVKDVDGDLDEILTSEFGNHWGQDLPTGAIIGAVDLISCLRMSMTKPEHEDDEICGNWSPERFAWKAGPTVKLADPIPYRGQQGMWTIPAAEIQSLIDQIAREYPE